MADESQRDVKAILSDPLSEVTRKERRSLLGLSTVGLAMALLRFLPAEITTMSIKFDAYDKSKLMLLIAGIIFYYLIAFILYFRSDHLRWRLAMKEAVDSGDRQSNALEQGSADEHEHAEMKRRFDLYSGLYKSGRIRGVFEFYVPIAIALSSMASLVLVSHGYKF